MFEKKRKIILTNAPQIRYNTYRCKTATRDRGGIGIRARLRGVSDKGTGSSPVDRTRVPWNRLIPWNFFFPKTGFFFARCFAPTPARRYGANKPFDRMVEKRPKDGKRNTANGIRFFMAVLPFFRSLPSAKRRSWEVPFSIIRRSRDVFCNIQ